MDSSFETSSFEAESFGEQNNNQDLETLRRENALLKAQFEEAVLSVQKTKDAQKTADALRAQLNKEKSEREELTNVLELTEKNVKEAELKLQKQKRVANEERSAIMAENNERVKAIQEQYQKENDDLLETIQQLNEERENNIIMAKTLSARLERIYQAATRHFNTEVNSLESLRDVLKRPAPQPAREVVQRVEVQPQNDEKALLYQKKAQKLAKKVESLKQELKLMQRNESDALTAARRENTALTAKVAALEEQIQFKEQQSEERVQSLEKRLAASNDELGKCRAQLNDLALQSQQIALPPVQEEIKDPIEELEIKEEKEEKPVKKEESTDEIQNCICDLKKQVATSEERNKCLAARIIDMQKQFNEQKTLLTNEQVSRQSLEAVHRETVAELTALRQTLVDRQRPLEEAQIALNDYMQKEEQSKKKMADAKKKVADLNAKISELQREGVRSQDTIDQMRRELAEVKDENKQLEKANSIAREESTSLRFKLDNIKPLTANDLLPPQVWTMSEAGEELSEQISKISTNSSLQPASKLQNIYSAIKKHYNDIIDSLEDEVDKLNQENAAISNRVNSFFVNASIILNEEAFTFEDFLKNDGGNTFINQLTELKNSYETLKNDFEALQNFANEFTEQFGENEDKIAHVKEIKDLLDSAYRECEKRGNRCRKLKRAVREYTDIAEEQIYNLKKKNEELMEENESLNSRLTETQKTLSIVKNENMKIQKELNEEKETRQAVEGEMHEQTQKYIDELNMTHVFEQQQKQKDINNRDNILAQKDDKIADLTQKLEKANLQIRILTEKNEDLENEISETNERNEKESEETIEKYEAEKNHMIETFNASLEELRNQCDKHRSDIINLSEQLNKEETNNGMLKAAIAACQKDKNKISRDLVLEREQLERKRKLIETECRTKIISAESNYERKLDEERAKAEDQKKEIYSFIAREFNQFYKPIDRLNEATFRSVVHGVHDALEAMKASDSSIRNMLGAVEGQTTEDAVAQSLMH